MSEAKLSLLLRTMYLEKAMLEGFVEHSGLGWDGSSSED